MAGRFVDGERIRTDDVAGHLYRGLGDGPHPGVLVVHGGGGAGGYERGYAARLAEHGYTALCVEYFGAPGVRDAFVDVPLEEFRDAAEWLLDRPTVAGDRVGVVGFSRGGEASLLIGSYFDVAGAVAAYVPTGYVWAAPSWMDGVDENQPSWTLDDEPVPFVPIDRYIRDSDDLGADEGDLASGEDNATVLALERAPETAIDAARIPVERIDGPVLLVGGGRDQVIPSDRFAGVTADRLEAHDHPCPVDYRTYPEAGHAIRVPYRFEGTTDPDDRHKFGGTHAANARASADAWQAALDCLDGGIAPAGR